MVEESLGTEEVQSSSVEACSRDILYYVTDIDTTPPRSRRRFFNLGMVSGVNGRPRVTKSRMLKKT